MTTITRGWKKTRVKLPRGQSYTTWTNGPWTILEQVGNREGFVVSKLRNKTIYELAHLNVWKDDFSTLAQAKKAAR